VLVVVYAAADALLWAYVYVHEKKFNKSLLSASAVLSCTHQRRNNCSDTAILSTLVVKIQRPMQYATSPECVALALFDPTTPNCLSQRSQGIHITSVPSRALDYYCYCPRTVRSLYANTIHLHILCAQLSLQRHVIFFPIVLL
jgi:hypothetical protein